MKKKLYYYFDWLEDMDFRTSCLNYNNSKFVKDRLNNSDYITTSELKSRMDGFIEFLIQLELNLLPYEKLDEMNAEVLDFLGKIRDNTVFELYISNDEYLSREFDKFIDLFKYYLTNIRKISCEMNKISTNSSIKYRFNSKELDQNSFNKEMEEFKEFLEIAEVDPQKILLNSISNDKIENVHFANSLREILKEWKRLKIDIQITSERKRLDFKEYYLNKMVDTETLIEVRQIEEFQINSKPLDSITSIYHINAETVKIYQQSDIQEIASVDKLFSGEVINYNENDKELLKYFVELADKQMSNQLKKYLDELKDKNTKIETKKTLKSKLTSFLLKNLQKIDEQIITELIKYLAKLVFEGN